MLMRIEEVEVVGWRPAARGMRNPLESWARSDTLMNGRMGPSRLGPKDLKLGKDLTRSGGSHRKFQRMIIVYADVTAARYWWQEFATYKVGTVTDSCSTMFKLGSRPLTKADFADGLVLDPVLDELNAIGEQLRVKRDKAVLRRMKAILPEGYLLKATVMFSYEVALHILSDRSTHRLPEWSGPGGFCEWLRTLPHLEEFERAAKGEKDEEVAS